MRNVQKKPKVSVERSSSFVNSTSVVATIKDERKKRNKSVNNDITPISAMFPDIVHSRSALSNSSQNPCISIHTLSFATSCVLLSQHLQSHHESFFVSIPLISFPCRKEMTQKQHWMAINKKLNAFEEVGGCVLQEGCSAVI